MKKTKITAILAGGLLASTYSASAVLVSVLSYDADNGTGTGTPSTLANGTSIPDQSGAGNDGRTENGLSGIGFGEVSTVEDDPNGVTGELSFSFDGSSARIVSLGTDLLTDDLIAANGGYTMSTWIKLAPGSNLAPVRSLMGFAGTDGLNVAGGVLNVIHTRGNPAYIFPTALDDDTWHHIVISVDTSADPDGTANSTPGGPSGGVHGLEGQLTVSVDGVVSANVATLAIGDFGDSLDRTISVGGHPQGLEDTEFTGLLYNPTVSLGVEIVPEPSSAALLGLGGLALILRRRK